MIEKAIHILLSLGSGRMVSLNLTTYTQHIAAEKFWSTQKFGGGEDISRRRVFRALASGIEVLQRRTASSSRNGSAVTGYCDPL